MEAMVVERVLVVEGTAAATMDVLVVGVEAIATIAEVVVVVAAVKMEEAAAAATTEVDDELS